MKFYCDKCNRLYESWTKFAPHQRHLNLPANKLSGWVSAYDGRSDKKIVG